MNKITILSNIPAWTKWTLFIKFIDEDFSSVKINDIKEDTKVYEFVVRSVEKIFEEIPVEEVELLKNNTDIWKFINLLKNSLSDEKIDEILCDFSVFFEEWE